MGLRILAWTLAAMTLPTLIHASEMANCNFADVAQPVYTAAGSSGGDADQRVPRVVAGLLTDGDADKNQFDDCCIAKLPCCRNSREKF